MTDIHPQIVPVELGARAYAIQVAPGLLAASGDRIRTLLAADGRQGLAARLLVIADATVARLHGPTLMASLAAAGLPASLTTFPAGEEHKSLATADQLWQACASFRIDRAGSIIALGGGVTGDVAGFVAATWMRGIRCIQIPTTLLAMVDSSVGGKTGVNSSAGKNLIGAFHQPAMVLIDPTVLASMDGREYRAGLAEVVKYGVIADPAFFAWQEAHAERLRAGDPDVVAQAVITSCRIKARYVMADETEQGVRAELNYGHTFGHALERDTGYRRYLHGEAVGIGMRMAATLAARLGVCEDADLAERQDRLLGALGLPLTHACPDLEAAAQRLTALCGLDKKVAAGRTRFILPRRIGSVTLSDAPGTGEVAAAFASALVPGA